MQRQQLRELPEMVSRVRRASTRAERKDALTRIAQAVACVHDADAAAASESVHASELAPVLAEVLEASQAADTADPFLHTLTLSILANLAFLGAERAVRESGALPLMVAAIHSARPKTRFYAVAGVQNVRCRAARMWRALHARAAAARPRAAAPARPASAHAPRAPRARSRPRDRIR